MKFQLLNLDLAGGLQQPLIAAGLVLCAVLLATSMLFVLSSKRASGHKLLLLAGLLALSPVAGLITEILLMGVLMWLYTRNDPDIGVGFIGRAPLGFVPLVAVTLTGAGQAVRAPRRRAAALRTR